MNENNEFTYEEQKTIIQVQQDEILNLEKTMLEQDKEIEELQSKLSDFERWKLITKQILND